MLQLCRFFGSLPPSENGDYKYVLDTVDHDSKFVLFPIRNAASHVLIKILIYVVFTAPLVDQRFCLGPSTTQ